MRTVALAIYTLISRVAGSTSALNRALEPNVSGADQCCASFKGLPRTSKLKFIETQTVMI